MTPIRVTPCPKAGDWLDARDSVGNWRVVQVLSKGTDTVRVLFPFKVEEDFSFDSPKVGSDSGVRPDRRQRLWSQEAAWCHEALRVPATTPRFRSRELIDTSVCDGRKP